MRGPFLTAVVFVLGQYPLPAQEAQDTDRRLAAATHLLMDWAGLTRYGSENAELRPPKPGEDRVVFLGDDLTEFWSRSKAGFFPGKPYLNRGIARQTSPQMLV